MPPSSGPLLRQDCLFPDALPHWLLPIWFPEQWDETILPLEFESRTLYLSTRGLVLFLPQADNGAVLVEGRTGEASSSLRIERHDTQYTLQGTYEGENVHLTIDLSPGLIHVRGPACNVRSDYEVYWDGRGWKVEGTTGEFVSHFRLEPESETRVRIDGKRRGEDVHEVAWWENGSLCMKSGEAQCTIRQMGENRLIMDGDLRDRMGLELTRTAHEVRVVEGATLGKVNYQIVSEENGIVVKGRLRKSFVNYKVQNV